MRLKQNFLYTLLFSIYTISAFSQSQITVSALTESVLLVHIDEGYVEHHGANELTNSDLVFYDGLLDLVTALNDNFSEYLLTSETDENYFQPTNPVTFNRKSKATEFANFCESYGYLEFFGTDGCINERDHVKEHFIYLTLETPLTSGNEYELAFYPYITDEEEYYSFIYDENSSKTEAIHVNNIGYSTEAEAKYAYVYHWMGDGGALDLTTSIGNEFHLINNNTNQVAYTGNLAFRADENTIETFQENPLETPNQNFNQAKVYECDFSDFNEPGRYRLCVDGIGCSYDFDLACDALRPAFQLVMKGLFHQRSGIELSFEHTEFPRPAPHNPNITPGFSGRLKYTSTTLCEVSDADASMEDKALWDAGIQGDLEAWGWYQDAGDWDAYLNHMDVPAKLLFTYEHFPDNFTDQELNIPESGNNIPDILDEALWLMRFYYRLKFETEQKGWTTGGVPGQRIFGDLWGEDLPFDLGRGSWEDNDRTWVVSGEDPVASYYYAGLAAHFAYLVNRDNLNDPDFVDWTTEAVNAYNWAEENSTSDYQCHDGNIRVLKNYAAAALYRLTENSTYNQDFISSFEMIEEEMGGVMQGKYGFGSYIYATLDNTPMGVSGIVENLILNTASFFLLDNIDLRATRWGGNHYFPMLAGQGTTPYVFEGIMAYGIYKEEQPTLTDNFKKYLHTTADYFLGTNPLNMTWITGMGEKSPTGVFHLDSRYGNNGEIIPGIVPYGPWLNLDYFGNAGPFNNQWPYDKVYPEINTWPGHERWFDQYYAPLACEFTIHQNAVNAAALYGALSSPTDCTEVLPSSIQTSEKFVQFSIYPNPTSDFVLINNEQNVEVKKLVLTDLQGRVVVMQEENLENMNVSNLSKGVYFLEIIGRDFSDVKKVIVQ